MFNTNCLEAPVTTNEPHVDTVESGTNFVDTNFFESLEAAVIEVKECLKKTALSHLVLGRKIAGFYNSEFGSDLRRKLVTDGFISDSYFSMYVKIGSSKVMANEKYLGNLPSSINSLYNLARLSEDELERAILSGEVTPSLLLKDAREMKKSRGKYNKQKAGTRRNQTHTLSFKIAEEDWQKYRTEIDNLIAKIKNDQPYLVVKEVK